MKGLKITVEEIDIESVIPEEMKVKAKELHEHLKAKYNTELHHPDIQIVLSLFEDIFRPLTSAYQKGEVTVDVVAAALIDSLTKWNRLGNVLCYAQEHYKVDMTDAPYGEMIVSNTIEIIDAVDKMYHEGKSLDDAYKFLVKMRASYVDAPKGVN